MINIQIAKKNRNHAREYSHRSSFISSQGQQTINEMEIVRTNQINVDYSTDLWPSVQIPCRPMSIFTPVTTLKF